MPAVVNTEIGRVLVDWSDAGITRVMLNVRHRLCPPGPDAPRFVHVACDAIADHLSGKMRDFREIPVDFGTCTPFFKKVWAVLRDKSRPGQVMTYGQLASLAGSPEAARAVGSSMARNPVPVIVPCHRVVGVKDQGGYSAGDGIETKIFLQELEKKSTAAARPSGRRR